MVLQRKNLLNELTAARRKQVSENVMMAEVQNILSRNEAEREGIKKRIDDADDTDSNSFVFDLLDAERIFHIDQIKNICIDYRLRFLNSRLFKGTVPEEAISKIREMEKQHSITLNGFKIMAPSKVFSLKNYDDPLLFAPIGNSYYYLIHQWGNDMSAYRKLMVRPMRDFGSLLVFLVFASLIFALFVDRYLFEGTNHDQFLLVAFLFTFKGFCGIALYYCFWKGKNFNYAIWDSEFYNK